jgi:hypothetical protein
MYENFGIKVFDNFLSPTYFNQIKNLVLSPTFDWHYSCGVTRSDQNEFDEFWKYGFNHLILDDGTIHSKEILDLLLGFHSKVLDFSGCNLVLRSRFDMTTFTSAKRKYLPHIDILEPNVTCVFYITDSESPTEIYQNCFDYAHADKHDILYSEKNLYELKVKETIYPKENRIVMFDGSHFHTGYSPENSKNRVLLNVNVCKR